MIWPFRRRAPSPPPPTPRRWIAADEAWRLGDMAECIDTFSDVREAPPRVGARLLVIDVLHGPVRGRNYETVGLRFPGFVASYEANAFRKIILADNAADRKVSRKRPVREPVA